MLARYLLQIIGSLAIMFAVSPKLTGVLLAVVPLAAIGAQRYGEPFVRTFYLVNLILMESVEPYFHYSVSILTK